MKKSLIILLVLSAWATLGWAQGVSAFNLYVYDPSRINPAFVGSTHRHAFSFYGNAGFNKFQGRPQTYQVGYETYLPGLTSGVGLRIANDNIGAFSQQQISGLYSYQRKIGKSTLSVGTGISRQTEVIDSDIYSLIDPDDPLRRKGSKEGRGWKADAGLAYQYKGFTASVAMQQITISKIVYEQETLTVTTQPVLRGYAAYTVNFNEHLSLHPSMMHVTSDGRNQTDLNVYLSVYKTGLIGVSYNGAFSSDFTEWRIHGGIKAFGVVECLLLYVPEGKYSPAQGDLLLRMTFGKRENKK